MQQNTIKCLIFFIKNAANFSTGAYLFMHAVLLRLLYTAKLGKC